MLPNSGLWGRVAGLHPAQILRPQHLIALKMPPAPARLMFCTKNRYFFDLAIRRSRTRLGNNHICNLLPLKCAPCHRKATILTNLIFIEIQKTPLAIGKLMFLIAQVFILSEQIL